MLLKIIKKITENIFRPTCVLCCDPSLQEKDLCIPCEKELPWILNACSVCALPLSEKLSPICGKCLQDKPPFEKTIALCRYEFPLTHLITSLKFHHQLTMARLLGELLAEKIKSYYEKENLPQQIIPIPLHVERLRERGFNQALEIARPIAKKYRIKINVKNCKRIRATQTQMSLAAKERDKNVKGAFEVNAEGIAEHVAVLDDVITTGHTMLEFCKQLQKAGVKKIDVWCCARTSLGRLG
jgi:ComF family protein